MAIAQVDGSVKSFSDLGQLEPITKVIIFYDNENAFEAGTDDGRALEAFCPYATQAMANNILASVEGYAYHPYTAAGAFIDPSIELGDGINVNGIYSVMAYQDIYCNAGYTEDISAPGEKEVDHEYPYLGTITREMNKKVTLGQPYYGTTISRSDGLKVEKISASGNVIGEFVANSDVISMRSLNSQGQMIDNIYFDAVTNTFRIAAVDALNDTVNAIETNLEGISLSAVSASGNTYLKLSNGAGADSQVRLNLSVSNNQQSSEITMTAGEIVVASQTIQFTGQIIFANNLTDGVTTISGDNISTGTIQGAQFKSIAQVGGNVQYYFWTRMALNASALFFDTYNTYIGGDQTVEINRADVGKLSVEYDSVSGAAFRIESLGSSAVGVWVGVPLKIVSSGNLSLDAYGGAGVTGSNRKTIYIGTSSQNQILQIGRDATTEINLTGKFVKFNGAVMWGSA